MSACLEPATSASGSASLPTGPTNSVLDVDGVGLGHTTLSGTRRLRPRDAASRAPASPAWCSRRTPTPGRWPRAARCSTAPGECTGFLTAREWGAVETPVYLTSTMQLGRVYDAACEIALERRPGRGRRRGDPGGGRVRRLVPQRLPAHAGRAPTTSAPATRAALASRGSTSPPAEGAVGGGHRDVVPRLQGWHRHVVAGDPSRAHGRGAAAHQLRAARPAHRGRGARSGGCSPTRTTATAAAGRFVHRRGRHRRARSTGADCARLARRIGLGLARTGSTRAPRKRRDLPGRLDDRADRPRRRPTPARRGSRAAAWTTCSRRSSTPPRRRCSTRC